MKPYKGQVAMKFGTGMGGVWCKEYKFSSSKG